jgi:polar amino acid transport system substrate-binding protein
LTDACSSGAIDIGFMPADDERRRRVDFSSPCFVIESTYLVAGPSAIETLAEVDRREVTVVGIAGSTTMRAAGRSLKSAKVVPAKSVEEAMGMMKAGTAQAFALTHDALPTLQKHLPGSRILDGAFQTTGVASPCKRIARLRSNMSRTSWRAPKPTALFDAHSMTPD